MKTFQDNFWLWGQNAGTHHACYPELPGSNQMEPTEGAAYLGIPNCCRVVMLDKPAPPFDDEAQKLSGFRQVVWSAIGAGGVERNNNDQSDLDEVLRQAARHPNVTGAVLDDFFPSVEGFDAGGQRARHSIRSIETMRKKLHEFPQRRLDLWLVWYSYQLEFPVQDYVDLCDVVTLWTWKGSDLDRLDENIERMAELTPGKRRLAGCYLWNYGERTELTRQQMESQLASYQHWLNEGVLEGVVFCSNCVADCGLEAAEITKRWIHEVGPQPLPATASSRTEMTVLAT